MLAGSRSTRSAEAARRWAHPKAHHKKQIAAHGHCKEHAGLVSILCFLQENQGLALLVVLHLGLTKLLNCRLQKSVSDVSEVTPLRGIDDFLTQELTKKKTSLFRKQNG